MLHSLSAPQVAELASTTHGYVAADLQALCSEAALECLRRHVAASQGGHRRRNELPLEFSGGVRPGDCGGKESPSCSTASTAGECADAGVDIRATWCDFRAARLRVRASAMREVALEVPRVRWADIGGNQGAKQALREAVEWPQRHSDALRRIGAIPPKGLLLYGPPGCSKTLLAKAVASEARLNFLSVKGPELLSKFVGESEKAVRALFAKARQCAPSVVFFDEIDGLVTSRGAREDSTRVGDRVLSQLLTEIDGLSPLLNVTVIGATNRPDLLDSALLRPGRFDRLVYVPPPATAEERAEVFQICLKSSPCAADVDTLALGRSCPGYTGADIAAVYREAALASLEESIDAVEIRAGHFEKALLAVKRSVSSVSDDVYRSFSRLAHG